MMTLSDMSRFLDILIENADEYELEENAPREAEQMRKLSYALREAREAIEVYENLDEDES